MYTAYTQDGTFQTIKGNPECSTDTPAPHLKQINAVQPMHGQQSIQSHQRHDIRLRVLSGLRRLVEGRLLAAGLLGVHAQAAGAPAQRAALVGGVPAGVSNRSVIQAPARSMRMQIVKQCWSWRKGCSCAQVAGSWLGEAARSPC
jgi:hypothetical protein